LVGIGRFLLDRGAARGERADRSADAGPRGPGARQGGRAEFDKDTLPKIKQDWIDTGKAKLIYRDFPLDGLALRAAMLARCAPPERYFAFIDTLFQSQQSWARNDWEPALGRIAKLGGMSEEQFKKCMSDEALGNAVVQMRTTAANEYGVESTPTFFINGTKLLGAAAYPVFDKALSTAQPKT